MSPPASAAPGDLAPGPEGWMAGAVVRRDQPLPPQVYALMRRAIIEGALEPGMSLSEPAIARHLDVSRTPVRESLLRLRRDGLVDIRPQSGTFVAAIDRSRVEEGMMVREALEPRAAAAAATRITDPAVFDLELETERMTAAAARRDKHEFVAADDRFHRLLIEAGGLRHLAAIIEQARGQLDRVRYISAGVPARPQTVVREHRHIVAMLKARDAARVGKAVERHHVLAWPTLRAALDALAPVMPAA